MFAMGVILFIMEFGVPPFTIAIAENAYYRIFYRDSTKTKLFFRIHPKTKELYNRQEIDIDLMDLILTMLDPNP